MTRTDAFFGIVSRFLLIALMLTFWAFFLQQVFNHMLSDLFFGAQLTFKQALGFVAVVEIFKVQ